ncbi:hypothetical protein BDV96DRAFT_636090 [Lophiotrema nucula]|uniref:Uncharacterized protein n=1 Tax=Lophiotrema nucula TaxID=690887 RepID=A0A6A5YTH5_9PLEO|nr:hypothetical protein BDV96DRAFT_636090 [Lophiotrema nucula]
MSSLFCCSDTRGYKNLKTSHESKFETFMSWAKYPCESESSTDIPANLADGAPYAIQLVRQVNYGPLESKRYFVLNDGAFVEVPEKWLIDANFQKLNTYKNFKCTAHNKFFEINVYQKDPVNKHHWRANVARPGSEIDL